MKKWFCMVLMLPVFSVILLAAKAHAVQVLPESSAMLRLHVVAQSDSERDQSQKLLVRDTVLRLLADDMQTVSSKEEAQAVVQAHLDEIVQASRQTLAANGSDADVSVSLQVEDFPSICYNGQIVPRGEYLALRVVIGEGMGRNWWCVLFPPLCYADVKYDRTMEGSLDTPQQVQIRWFFKEWMEST